MRKATMGAGAHDMRDMVHPGMAFRCVDRDPVGAPHPRRRLDPPDPRLRRLRRNLAIITGLAIGLWALTVWGIFYAAWLL